MADDVFTDTDETAEDWVDVRMTDPERGEWDIDAVVAGGQVEYVDLRIDPALLSGFIECLVGDVGDERAARVLARTADRLGLDPATLGDRLE
ncbi:hypothetical protein [Haloarcula pelagica]|uniref:hypothetical protein n=1 Tax=Haloarcula pelagica TaxID=3033389 RepID=UPI0024C3FA3C|nr:hypothetical protein [Halomicroarcula sp. YJ-61-S]